MFSIFREKERQKEKKNPNRKMSSKKKRKIDIAHRVVSESDASKIPSLFPFFTGCSISEAVGGKPIIEIILEYCDPKVKAFIELHQFEMKEQTRPSLCLELLCGPTSSDLESFSYRVTQKVQAYVKFLNAADQVSLEEGKKVKDTQSASLAREFDRFFRRQAKEMQALEAKIKSDWYRKQLFANFRLWQEGQTIFGLYRKDQVLATTTSTTTEQKLGYSNVFDGLLDALIKVCYYCVDSEYYMVDVHFGEFEFRTTKHLFRPQTSRFGCTNSAISIYAQFWNDHQITLHPQQLVKLKEWFHSFGIPWGNASACCLALIFLTCMAKHSMDPDPTFSKYILLRERFFSLCSA
jgi:hypothetical protein